MQDGPHLPRRPEPTRWRDRRVARLAPAVAALTMLAGAACGGGHRARTTPFFDAAGRPSAAAADGAGALTWRARAAIALGTTETFFRTMPMAPGASVDRQAIIRTCQTALPNLTTLSLQVEGAYPDAAVERHVREALSGFSQYVEACAAGDDARADEGFHFYDEGWQAASLALGSQSSPDAQLASSP